ncbi:hypothetical protein COOONC_08535, partial [Cooperia oncophora]
MSGILSRQGVSQRQQTIVYITNDTNPFEENWATQLEGYFTRMKKGVASFRHQQGKRTSGEFSVVLLRKEEDDDDDETYEKDTRVWKTSRPPLMNVSEVIVNVICPPCFGIPGKFSWSKKFPCEKQQQRYRMSGILSRQGVSQRQQTIVYITNDTNPFEENWATQLEGYFTRMKKGVASFRHQQGKRTSGEFSVVLLRKEEDDDDDETYEKDTRVWRQLDPNIGASKSIEDLETQLVLYLKTFSLRSFSNIGFELGPGVKFSVSVYALASEARPPPKEYLDYETENPLEKRQIWVPRDGASQAHSQRPAGDSDEFEDELISDVLEDTKWLEKEVGDRTRAKFELKKAIKVGGECIVSEQSEIEELGRFDAKEKEVGDRTRAKFELKKAIKVGGECIVSEQSEIEELGRFDAKGSFLPSIYSPN